ncbi:hypothetical protein ACI1G1_000311 [Vibrio cholerae]|uniref:hypothetical protein n=1 Tax=Vibrio cholerae TaxID=666 RepID=UPI0028DA5BD0|nr:hypothetical protein [Vibrio cholerae]EKF9795931.1 hypothetical protein [Vibrio cholerae]HDL9506165.1 hypothetical protein [Vibrio cholerae]HDZ9471026.1 hypothetical protein [Vibrio cholerae]
MKNLKEFLSATEDSSNSKEVALKNVSTGVASAVLLSGVVSTKSKAEKFAQEVTKLAGSEDVMSELSEEVGAPLSNESEEEFVARAKKSFKKILMTKMSSK